MKKLEDFIGKPHEDDIGMEYKLYCFLAKKEGLDCKGDDYDTVMDLISDAEDAGLAILSVADCEDYWIGCLPDKKGDYGVVDHFFEKFKKIKDCVYNEPKVRTADWDGIGTNTFDEYNRIFYEE